MENNQNYLYPYVLDYAKNLLEKRIKWEHTQLDAANKTHSTFPEDLKKEVLIKQILDILNKANETSPINKTDIANITTLAEKL
ncbi:hypothetical protein [Mycoplasma miroungirhinis]|uniref:Uncharacterized protein n=1 Tax=Mycoplasma miroungirhinis TaxID=754516 RepID=A0A6M4JH55_9MOLU|nr:hypothetical protein [Mycoplasma miroungirhinis]QJR44352.1 hypothetical protein HLA92_02840 [Mycoplasma miroungirhinis]